MTRFTAFLFLLLLLILHTSSGEELDLAEPLAPVEKHSPFRKKIWRKLMEDASVLDYDDGGPNPRHDPRKGKPPSPKNR